ncbi:MAG: lysophospholipid acyltransferase family protein [Blastocatellia bacterium]|nr:lysophospholipid acyltransferase family protein [Blastocatellia bacterium]MCS7157090.1 lysophospholipid acyltransferase family protein [Blastocatellia bacterium]MCX7752291.1 lysophospholipid acyltransferase family protein [Blastocatellia bacterium]MDW8167783.1 lysophospholipid acyltransferase family protein [Acidobacteriota bacterium]MDW8256604.1 lysophospholipid acyltransferase family protein [Acidobacteriota bacterium]
MSANAPAMTARRRTTLRHWIEYVPAWLILKALGHLPRSWALAIGEWLGLLAYCAWGRLRRVGYRNLALVFPQMSTRERRHLLRRAFRNLGRSLGEFSQFPKLTRETIRAIVTYEGLEHYERARAQGRGVLILTAHFGAWELSAFAHALYGYRMAFLARPLDNPLLDRLIETYRALSGNRLIPKREAARRVRRALRQGETIGVLMDLNTQPHEGLFCDFFGRPACTSPLLAHLALRTEAPVIPGFLIWDERTRTHILHFDPPIPLIRTGDPEQDLRLNTERFNKVLESFIRRYPDHWLWVHKRWHTRPPGEPPLYD